MNIQLLTGHAAHLVRLAIVWRRVAYRCADPMRATEDHAEADRLLNLALGGAK